MPRRSPLFLRRVSNPSSLKRRRAGAQRLLDSTGYRRLGQPADPILRDLSEQAQASCDHHCYVTTAGQSANLKTARTNPDFAQPSSMQPRPESIPTPNCGAKSNERTQASHDLHNLHQQAWRCLPIRVRPNRATNPTFTRPTQSRSPAWMQLKDRRAESRERTQASRHPHRGGKTGVHAGARLGRGHNRANEPNLHDDPISRPAMSTRFEPGEPEPAIATFGNRPPNATKCPRT